MNNSFTKEKKWTDEKSLKTLVSDYTFDQDFTGSQYYLTLLSEPTRT